MLGISRDDYVLVDADDAEQTKPAPDLLATALKKASAEKGFAIGDSVYDGRAGLEIDVPTVSLLTGGVGKEELLAAGAVAVRQSPRDLLDHLDEVLATLKRAMG